MKELIAIQSTLNAPKGQFNKFGNYKYRSCEDILAAVKPLLNKFGCTLTLSDDVVTVGNRIYIKATATLANASGEREVTTAYAREEETKKGMDASQVTGAASSYARKYALNGLLAIDDTRDADASCSSPQPAKAQSQDDDLSPADIFRHYAKPAIQQAQSRKELTQIYNTYPILHGSKEFTGALSARTKELGI